MTTPLPPAIFLMGPTASGKTTLAVELSKYFPFEIISVDSALVYRGMNIGTAKPDADLLERAPHRLIDIRDPAVAYSAAEFRDDALTAMAGETVGADGVVTLPLSALDHRPSGPFDPCRWIVRRSIRRVTRWCTTHRD